MLDAGPWEIDVNEYSVEFDDFEEQFDEWLDRVVTDGIVVVITAGSVPLAAITLLPMWERLLRLEEEIENVESV